MTQGKGSTRRPHDVPTDTVSENWARTFGVTQARDSVTPTALCEHRHTYSEQYASYTKGEPPVFKCHTCGAVVI